MPSPLSLRERSSEGDDSNNLFVDVWSSRSGGHRGFPSTVSFVIPLYFLANGDFLNSICHDQPISGIEVPIRCLAAEILAYHFGDDRDRAIRESALKTCTICYARLLHFKEKLCKTSSTSIFFFTKKPLLVS